MSKELDEIRAREPYYRQECTANHPYRQPLTDVSTLLALVYQLRLQLQSERDENFTLNLTCAQLGDERDAWAVDARQMRELLQEAYEQGMHWRGDRIYKYVSDPDVSLSAKEAKHEGEKG